MSRAIETASLAHICGKPLRGDEVPQPLVDGGNLTVLQLEAVALAEFRFNEPLLPSGERLALLIADGAGSGKGRQLAGIMSTATMKHGCTKHVWVSLSADLSVDAQRDLTGVHAKQLAGLSLITADGVDYDHDLATPKGNTVLFITYHWLRSTDTASKRAKKGETSKSTSKKYSSRLEQLRAWLGDGFDGCIALDECHAAKAFGSGSKPSATGIAINDLLDSVPLARVAFASATFASKLSELCIYARRLGLVGTQTHFDSFPEMYKHLNRLGVTALEVISAELKSNNALLSRSLSYEGVVFETKDVAMSSHHINIQISATDIWARIYNLNFFNPEANAEGCTKGAIASTADKGVAASGMLRFWRNFQLWCKIDACFAEIEDAVAKGEAVVVGLVTTDAASDARVVASRAKAAGKRAVADSDDSDDDTATTAATDDADGLGSLTDAVNCVLRRVHTAAREHGDVDLLGDVAAIRADLVALGLESTAALDLLTDKCTAAGIGVAELTGRTHTFPLRADGTRIPVKKTDNLTLQRRFRDDELECCVISQAASTGISLHSDPTFANGHRKRRHVVLQLAWSASATLQACGRSHRSGQRSPPRYVVLSLGNMETRFSSVVGARIRSVSGTRGDGEARCGHGEMGFADEDLIGPHGETAATALYESLTTATAPPSWVTLEERPFEFSDAFAADALAALHGTGWRPKLVSTNPYCPRRFLNRLLGVSMRERLNERIFQLYEHLCAKAVFDARKRGRYHIERSKSIVIDGRTTIVSDATHDRLRIVETKRDDGVTYEQAVGRYDDLKARGLRPRFVKSKIALRVGRLHYHALTYRRDDLTAILIRPSGRAALYEAERLARNYATVSKSDGFRSGWTQELATADNTRYTRNHIALLPVLSDWSTVATGTSRSEAVRTVRLVNGSTKALGILLQPWVAASIPRRVAALRAKAAAAKVAAAGTPAVAAAVAVPSASASSASSIDAGLSSVAAKRRLQTSDTGVASKRAKRMAEVEARRLELERAGKTTFIATEHGSIFEKRDV